MDRTTRPLLLTSSLALSTIGSSVAMLTYFTTFFFFEQTLPFIVKATNTLTPGLLSRTYVLSLAALYLISLIGVIKMWKAKRTGFFFYLAAQTGIWVLPLIQIGTHAVSSTNTIFTLLFLSIYASFIKRFK